MERGAGRLAYFPKVKLSVPSRRKLIRVAPDTLPETFQGELERYLKDMAEPDLLSSNSFRAPLRSTSIEARRNQLLHFAGAMVRAGVPAQEITSLAALIDPRRLRQALEWLLERAGGKKTRGLHLTASALSAMIPHLPDLDPQAAEQALDLLRRLRMPRSEGMTDRNRERLRQVQNPEALRDLLTLPTRLFAEAEAEGLSLRALVKREDAVALAMLIFFAMRRSNLVRTRLDHHLERSGKDSVYLVYAGQEVKNGRTLEYEVPPELVRMINRLVAVRSPLLCPAGTPWLFPKRDGQGPMLASTMSTRISNRIRRGLGIEFNAHLFRHLSAMIYLSERPGHYEAARRLLGHSTVSSTISAYAGLKTRAVTRQFASFIEQARA